MFKRAHTLIPFISSDLVIETFVVARVAEERKRDVLRGRRMFSTFRRLINVQVSKEVSKFIMLILVLFTCACTLSRLVKTVLLEKENF